MPTLIRQARQLLDHGTAVVLITVADAKGSTPRDVGTRMLVTADQQWQTIGGGHLEWKAIHLARELIANAHDLTHAERKVEHFPLGPALAQCCGGFVTLVFELLSSRDLPWLEELAVTLSQGKSMQRRVRLSGSQEHELVRLEAIETNTGSHLLADAHDDSQWFLDHVSPPAMHIVLFGAGHVGKALVHMLSILPCTIMWVDERDSEFPSHIPSNVTPFISEFPEEAVALAPPNSCFIIMTHRHDVDLRLALAVLQRDDYRYAGFIGSLSKKAKFQKRFAQRGFSEEVIQRMRCPIGIPGIDSKEPAAIAVSIAAELLQLNQTAS